MNLRQLITKPTRITTNTESFLDVILVSSNSLVQGSGIIYRPISDQSVVFVKLNVKPLKPTPNTCELTEIIVQSFSLATKPTSGLLAP